MDINIPSQIVIQTAAQWAADTTVYSKRILVTSDVKYTGFDICKFKIADGVQQWSGLDYFPDPTTLDAAVLAAAQAYASNPNNIVQDSTHRFTTDTEKSVWNSNLHFRGKYLTLSALQSAVPVGNDGDYAIVDGGVGVDAHQYIWDAEAGWIQGDLTGITSVNGFTGPSVNLTTTNIPEGTNLYYTVARFSAAFATKSTTDLAEGSNLYYTDGRFDTRLAAKTTTNLAEGTNLYFTAARVLATVLTGLVAASGTPLATDTVLQAFGKIKNFIDNIGQGITFVARTSVAYANGLLFYDQDNNCLSFYNSESDVSLQIGQEEWLRVYNNSGATITNGQAVYINGNNAGTGLPTVALAKADAAATTVVAGMATHDIENNTIGFIAVSGTVRQLNTSALSIGSVFLSATTAGALTNTAPASPNYRYRVGFVTKVDTTTGTIQVTPSTAALGNGTVGQFLTINSAGSQAFRTLFPVKSTTTYAHTGTTTETVVFSQQIPAGTFEANDFLDFTLKIGATSNANNKGYRVYFGTNAQTVGSVISGTGQVQAALANITTSTMYSDFKRTITFKNSLSSQQLIAPGTSSLTDTSITTVPSTIAVDFSVAQYFFVTITLGNSADTANLYSVKSSITK